MREHNLGRGAGLALYRHLCGRGTLLYYGTLRPSDWQSRQTAEHVIQRLAPAAKDLRSVAILFSGGVLAQLVPLAASPVLGRLFSPVEFGL